MNACYMLADDRLRIQFETSDPTTQERADADSTPVATLYKNGVALTTVDMIVNNLDTGLYEVVVTLLDEYDLADRHAQYALSVAVTVGTKNGVAALGEWRIDPVNAYARGYVGQKGGATEGPSTLSKLAIVAPKYGPQYNGYTVEFQNDGAGAGSITGSAPSYVVHYADSTTTIANLVTLIESVGLRAVLFDDAVTGSLDGVFDNWVTDNQIVTLSGGADAQRPARVIPMGFRSLLTGVAPDFEFFVDPALIGGAPTQNIGVTGLVEANFTVEFRNLTGDWVTMADGDHVIVELSDGWYRFSGGGTYVDTGMIRIIYDPAVLPAGRQISEIWRERFTSGIAVPADVVRISGDTTAADNLEAQFDGTGLTGNTFPATQLQADTIDNFLDTEVAAIKAKTDNLPTDPADASDIAASFATVNTKLDAIDDFLDTEVAAILAAVDTEVAAIKAKTDNLPTDPADQSLLEARFDDVDTAIAALDFTAVTTQLTTIEGKIDVIDANVDAMPDDVLAAFRAWEHDDGVTWDGLMVRLEAWLSGERVVTGTGASQHQSYKRRDGSTAFEGDIDATTGSRAESDVTGSE